MVKVSVIMSVYNEKEFLLDSIRSILNQTFKDFEFIIIDDGSKPPILPLIESFVDNRIKLIVNEENMGLTASLNKGLFWANGEYLARQDADDISLPERLGAQVKYLKDHPEIAVVGTSYYVIDSKGKILEERKPALNPMSTLATGNRLTHGSVMFRRSIMEDTDIGKYDEAHFRYAQDYEYWLRISKKYEIRNIEHPLYKLRVHVNTVGIEKSREQALYVILAQRMAENMESCVLPSYKDLTKEERARFHNMVAYNHIQVGDIKTARKELYKSIEAQPTKESVGSFLLSYLSKERVLSGQNLYRQLRFMLQKHLRLSI